MAGILGWGFVFHYFYIFYVHLYRHYNHILLYNLKKREIEERKENNDGLQDSQYPESSENIYESLSSEENVNGSDSSAELSAYAGAFYNYVTNVFEYAYNNSANESWADISNNTLYSSIMELMIFDIQVDKVYRYIK